MLRKTLLLAIAAAATLILPAMASASGTWTHQGVPVTAETTVSATGPIQFESQSGAGGIECDTVHAKITITANQTASHVTEFDCTSPTTFGFIKEVFGCKVEGITTNVPFTATPTAALIDITEFDLVYTMNESCAFPEITVGDGVEPIIAVPDDNEEISDVIVLGEVETTIGPSNVFGKLDVSPAKTYGFE